MKAYLIKTRRIMAVDDEVGVGIVEASGSPKKNSGNFNITPVLSSSKIKKYPIQATPQEIRLNE